MLTMILDFLKSIGEAYRAAKADRASRDAVATKPLLEHADAAVEGIAAEIRKAGGSVPDETPRLSGMLPN